jgi:hypothetical protein
MASPFQGVSPFARGQKAPHHAPRLMPLSGLRGRWRRGAGALALCDSVRGVEGPGVGHDKGLYATGLPGRAPDGARRENA